jgi:hypothetical protein
VVIGDELATEDADFNMAYEITDNGLVVGQVAVEVAGPAGPTRVNRAFLYLTQRLFGFPDDQVVFLPSVDESGMGIPSIARDVNAAGWIVGDVGEPTPEFDSTLRRAAAWRLRGEGGIEVRRVPPPFGDPAGTYSWLSAVSEGDKPWAAFTSAGGTCTMGGSGVSSETVAAVQLDAAPAPFAFRGLCAGCAEADVVIPPGSTYSSGRTVASGISPSGGRMAGWRGDCAFVSFCNSPANTRARQWYPSSLCSGGDPSSCFSCISCITPDPVADPSGTVNDSAARQNAVLDNGIAAGFVADHWPGLAVPGSGCGPWAFVWKSIDPCTNPPACGGGAGAPPLGKQLPIPNTLNLVGSEAYDIELNANPAQGLCPGYFVVGEARYQITGKPDPARRGHVWFAAEDGLQGDWAAADINTLISPIPPVEEYSEVVVRSLRGVNRNGDAVGMAEFKRGDQPTGAPPIRRAVLLRAVPQRLNGDIDRDGTVGAADLATLLGAWCPEGSTQRCDALSDLSCDGWIGASDLAILLSNWSNTGGTAAFTQGGDPVPEELALESEEELEFSIQFVGLGDIEGYKAWAATAPAPLREIIDEFVWDITKGGVE